GLLLLDDAADGRLVEHLAHRHRAAVLDDGEQGLAPFLDLGLGGAGPFYGASLISRERRHRAASGRSSVALSARRRDGGFAGVRFGAGAASDLGAAGGVGSLRLRRRPSPRNWRRWSAL